MSDQNRKLPSGGNSGGKRVGELGESEAIKPASNVKDLVEAAKQGKIRVIIRHVLRVRPEDFHKVIPSLEAWAEQFDDK